MMWKHIFYTLWSFIQIPGFCNCVNPVRSKCGSGLTGADHIHPYSLHFHLTMCGRSEMPLLVCPGVLI